MNKLQDRLDAFKREFEAGAPPYNATPEMVATMHRATAELAASGALDSVLDVGKFAPDFVLTDADGVRVSSRQLLEKGPLVVTFYRGVWCPYCNLDLQALEAVRPALAQSGASLIAISPQTRANSRKSQRQNQVRFPILSDPGNMVAAKFGVRFRMPPYLIKLYEELGNDLPTINGDPSWTLPMPSRFLIGQDGAIRYREVEADYTRRPDPDELVRALDALEAASSAAPALKPAA